MGNRNTNAGDGANIDAQWQASTDKDEFVEAGNDHRSYASPSRFSHELEAPDQSTSDKAELLELLNLLLEGERAGARALGQIKRQMPPSEIRDVLGRVGRDEARFCAMLTCHIERLGGAPSKAVGDFFDKLMAIEAPQERIAFLNRGQGWVVRKLKDVLPRIQDELLRTDLLDMLEVHERNIMKCDQLNS